MKIFIWLLIFSFISLLFPARVDASCGTLNKEQSWWEYTLEKNYYQYRRNNRLKVPGEIASMERAVQNRLLNMYNEGNVSHSGFATSVKNCGIQGKEIFEALSIYSEDYENTLDGNTVLVAWNNSKTHKRMLDGAWTATGFECAKFDKNVKVNGQGEFKNPIICVGWGRR